MWTLAISRWCVSSAFQAAEEVKVLMEAPFSQDQANLPGPMQRPLAIVHNQSLGGHYSICMVSVLRTEYFVGILRSWWCVWRQCETSRRRSWHRFSAAPVNTL